MNKRGFDPMNRSAFLDLVKREAKGKATDAEREVLMSAGVLQEWMDALVDATSDIDAQVKTKEAELAVFRQECYRAGPYMKQEYHDAEAGYLLWRAKALRFKSTLASRLRDVKRYAEQSRQHDHATNKAADDRRFGQRIAAVEARVLELEATLRALIGERAA